MELSIAIFALSWLQVFWFNMDQPRPGKSRWKYVFGYFVAWHIIYVGVLLIYEIPILFVIWAGAMVWNIERGRR